MNNIEIDFEIYDTLDTKTFIVLDNSNWENLENKPSIIEIILPGKIDPVVRFYDKGVNKFNSKRLFLNCDTCNHSFEDLPDGIYDITVKGSPDIFNKNKKYLRLTKTKLDLSEIYASYGLECFNNDKDIKNKFNHINEINFLLRSAEANVRRDNVSTAQKLLFKAQKLIKKHNCKNCN